MLFLLRPPPPRALNHRTKMRIGALPTPVSRWWREADIQPHRVRTFKLSNDPRFEAKLRDVVAVLEKKRSPAW